MEVRTLVVILIVICEWDMVCNLVQASVNQDIHYYVFCCRIIRAFLIEEQKIVLKAMRAQKIAAKQKKVASWSILYSFT